MVMELWYVDFTVKVISKLLLGVLGLEPYLDERFYALNESAKNKMK